MIQDKTVAGILVAAGRSVRMGFDKLFYRIQGKEIVLLSLEKLAAHPYIDTLVVVAGENKKQLEELLAGASLTKPYTIVRGGDSRAASVLAGVGATQAEYVAIHDAARPFVTPAIISDAIEAAYRVGAAAPALSMKDTVKQVEQGFVAVTVPRHNLATVQTPQVFLRDSFVTAFSQISQENYDTITDDCMVMEMAGRPVILVEGDVANRKITTQQDLRKDTDYKEMRIGHSYDVHRMVSGRELILGGISIPYHLGLLGHSDADILCHVVMESMLGAAALGDLGSHFPDTDPAYKGAKSLDLLQHCVGLVRDAGYEVQNLDATLVCQAPKLAPRIEAMQKNLARILEVEPNRISIKATTEEGLGLSGDGEGMAAHCVVLLRER